MKHEPMNEVRRLRIVVRNLQAQNAELLGILKKILQAHESNGNGATMGEARLCRMYADTVRDAIQKFS